MIHTFTELPAEHLARAGGKGGTLARLKQAGFAVPDGFVILPSAFEGEALKPQAWQLAQASLNVARELGLPAVVGCGNATRRLKTGDRVRVNGGAGLVEILASSAIGKGPTA